MTLHQHRGPCARVVFSTARTGEQRGPTHAVDGATLRSVSGSVAGRGRLACWWLADYDALAVAVGAALTASWPSLGATPPFALWTGFDVDAEDAPVAAPVDLPSRRARALRRRSLCILPSRFGPPWTVRNVAALHSVPSSFIRSTILARQ